MAKEPTRVKATRVVPSSVRKVVNQFFMELFRGASAVAQRGYAGVYANVFAKLAWINGKL